MTNLDNVLKSRDITLPTMVPIVKTMVFPGVLYGCEGWIIKKAEHQTIMVQHSCPYMAAGKTVALALSTFVGKVMSLLFNMLSSFVIAFLPRRKCLLWLQSPKSTVILKPKKIKSVTVSIISPFLPLSDGARCSFYE